MRLRIVEFKEPQSKDSKNRFFVQSGVRIWKKLAGPIFYPSVSWDWVRESPDSAAMGHDTIEQAISFIEEIKKQQPKYHYVK